MDDVKEIFHDVDNATVLTAEIASSSRELAMEELEGVQNAV